MLAVSLIWVGLGIAGALGAGVTVLSITGKRLKVTDSTVSSKKRRSTALKVLIPVAGVLVAGGAALSQIHIGARTSHISVAKPATLDFIKINIPQLATPGNPLPSVSCIQTLSGTARVPNGDVIVVANSMRGEADWYFQPNVVLSGSRWHASVNFASSDKFEMTYQLAAFAMPRSWEAYLDTMYGQANPSAGGGWIYQELPPSRSKTFIEKVQRPYSKSGCP